jgi:hypothetical protein
MSDENKLKYEIPFYRRCKCYVTQGGKKYMCILKNCHEGPHRTEIKTDSGCIVKMWFSSKKQLQWRKYYNAEKKRRVATL